MNLIQQLINRLQNVTQPLGVLAAGAGAAFNPRNTLHLAQLSPRLAAASSGSIDTCVPLPGRAYLGLARISPRVSLFHTKTRPKRLLFVAHNGSSFPYLLKCLEDLRLDDRVMQLARLTNIAFRSAASSSSESLSTTARTYSVTPIGPRAGLIQMVQGAVPLFSLYKRWQQRRSKDEPGWLGNRHGQPMKPAELFYSELSQNLPPGTSLFTANRSAWPKEALRKVWHNPEWFHDVCFFLLFKFTSILCERCQLWGLSTHSGVFSLGASLVGSIQHSLKEVMLHHDRMVVLRAPSLPKRVEHSTTRSL